MFVIFLFTIGYLILIALSVFLIIKTISFIAIVKENRIKIECLEKEIYSELRELQFKSKTIGNFSMKLAKKKNSILGEFVPGILISLLPFKKLKSILLLYRLAKKLS